MEKLTKDETLDALVTLIAGLSMTFDAYRREAISFEEFTTKLANTKAMIEKLLEFIEE